MRKPYTIPYQQSGSAAGFTVLGRSYFMKEVKHEHT